MRLLIRGASIEKVPSNMRKIRRFRSSEHTQSFIRAFALHSSGPLLSIYAFCSIQWLCKRTVKPLIRLGSRAVNMTRRHIFAWWCLYDALSHPKIQLSFLCWILIPKCTTVGLGIKNIAAFPLTCWKKRSVGRIFFIFFLFFYFFFFRKEQGRACNFMGRACNFMEIQVFYWGSVLYFFILHFYW